MAVKFDGRYWRPASFYFAHFAGLGVLIPYWPVYLQAQNFTAVQISTIMSGFVCSRIIAPYFWGHLAERFASPLGVIRYTSVAALLSFSALVYVTSLEATLGLIIVFGLFWSAPLPQVEALTLASHDGGGRAYGWIRLWGSVGYILTAGLLGAYIDQAGPLIVPRCFLLALALISLVSLILPGKAHSTALRDTESFWRIVQRSEVAVLLLVCFLMQVGHGPYYTFFTIYLGNCGYEAVIIGRLWALGVIAEVGMFLIVQTLISRFGLRSLLLFALFTASVRWSLIAVYVNHLDAVVFAQLLHACTFGIFHAVTVQMIFYYFQGPHQGRGQALYSSLVYGGGGAIGALGSGYVWTNAGAAATFTAASCCSLLALTIGWLTLREPARRMQGLA